MDDHIQMLRMVNVPPDQGNPIMDWAFQFTDFTAAQSTDQYRRKDPVFLNNDPEDPSSFFSLGYYQGTAAIMKFQKRNGRLRWWLSFPQYTRINSYAMIPNTGTFFTCGHYWSNEATSEQNTDIAYYSTEAVITRIRDDGTPDLYMNLHGSNPVSTAQGKDECWGIVPQKDGDFATVMTVTMSSIRGNDKGDFRDLLLVTFNSAGTVQRAVVFTNGNIQKDYFLTNNALVNIDDMYFFAGHSMGYQTSLNKLIYAKDGKTGRPSNVEKTDYDAFVFRYIFDREDQQCLL